MWVVYILFIRDYEVVKRYVSVCVHACARARVCVRACLCLMMKAPLNRRSTSTRLHGAISQNTSVP
jgi:hypothetical protein